MASGLVTATKTVVIADDVAFVRDRFTAALQAAGHHTVSVGSAAELLARLHADSEIDLLLLDLKLPNAGGVDLVRAIRELPGGRLNILVFSGTIGGADEVRELTSLGVTGYINEYSAVEHILPSLAPHLFPDNFNRRSSPRVVLGVPIAYRFDNTIAGAVTLTLGKGGVAVRTMTPLNVHTKARIRLRLPGSRQELEAECRVAWSDRRVGMGLQFEQIDPAAQRAIDDFVDQQFHNNRKH